MGVSSDARWLEWSKRLQAIAQNGLTFARDAYDLERYRAIREIAAEMLAEGSGLEQNVILALLEKETGYATPKVDVRGVVFRESRLLLVREKSDGRWTLPGGWADVGESPAQNVVREIHEESGLEWSHENESLRPWYFENPGHPALYGRRRDGWNWAQSGSIADSAIGTAYCPAYRGHAGPECEPC